MLSFKSYKVITPCVNDPEILLIQLSNQVRSNSRCVQQELEFSLSNCRTNIKGMLLKKNLVYALIIGNCDNLKLLFEYF